MRAVPSCCLRRLPAPCSTLCRSLAGDLKLCDFGLARGLEGEAADAFDDHRHPVPPVGEGGASGGAPPGLPSPDR